MKAGILINKLSVLSYAELKEFEIVVPKDSNDQNYFVSTEDIKINRVKKQVELISY